MTEEQQKQLRRLAARIPQMLAERDALIVAAKDAGEPVTHIAAWANLSRAQVHRIIKEGTVK